MSQFSMSLLSNRKEKEYNLLENGKEAESNQSASGYSSHL